MLTCCLVIFFPKSFFQTIISRIPSECQIDWIQIKPEVLLGLIWVQTVCKVYQQTTLVADDCWPNWALKEKNNNLFSSSKGSYKTLNAHFLAKKKITAIKQLTENGQMILDRKVTNTKLTDGC